MCVLRAFRSKCFLLPLVFLVFNVLESRTCYHSANDQNDANRDSLLLTLDDSSKINNTRQTPKVDISEEEVRLEYIKRQILQKLGMRGVPKVKRKTLDTSIYQPILEQQLSSSQTMQSSTAAPEESDKLFVFPTRSEATKCIFNLTLKKRSKYSIRRISLFVKHQRSDEQSADIKLYSLSSMNGGNSSAENLLAVVQPIADTNEEVLNDENLLQTWLKWNEYNLTQILLSKLVTPSDSNNQLILVDSEQLKIFSSFITIEYDYINTQRSKRSINCNANGNSSSCCRETFYVNFTHIHWDDWILQPAGYNANYCRGTCDISNARYHHTTVVQKYQSVINLCCSPREMSSIPLIYIDENGYVLKKILMNMVVESCDCA